MTKGQALQTFFSSFLAAYPATSVPDDSVFPWLTYELITGAFDSGEIGLTVDLWFYTDSEAEPNAKAQEIADELGPGGKILPCDGGYIWLKRGSPWCTALSDETSRSIKRRKLNITAEYLTQN